MSTTAALDRRRELGEFIRAQREKLTPALLGLPLGSRRRTPGLRREEIAQLSGLSTTWYTWIEQGREVSASAEALGRLAAVLRLGRAERAYLFEVAGKHDPDLAPGDSSAVPPTVFSCVDAIAAPAYVLDRHWSALSWNAAAARLFVGWLDSGGERNLLRYIFLRPAARKLISDWETRARRVVAEFRAASSAYWSDAGIRALVAELQTESHEFAQYWEQHAVLGREGGERDFQHPRDGHLQFQQVTFNLASAPEFKLTMLLPLSGTHRRGPAAGKAARPRPPSQRRRRKTRGGGRSLGA